MNDAYYVALGANIKRERQRKELTQADLGALLGKHYSTISLYESGEVDPGVKRLKQLAKVFGCSINKLLPVT